MSARRVWRIRRSRRMAGETASGARLLRPRRRLSHPDASRAASAPIAPCIASPASRSAPPGRGSWAWVARADGERASDILLDLPLLPARRRIAEIGLEQKVADHGRESCVDLALLSAPDLVDGGSHIIVRCRAAARRPRRGRRGYGRRTASHGSAADRPGE